MATTKIMAEQIADDAITTDAILDAAVTADKVNNEIAQVLDMNTTAVDVVSTTAETTIYTYSVPANTLGTGNALYLTLTGTVRDRDGTVILRVKYGATTICTTVDTQSFYNTNTCAYFFWICLKADTSTNAQYATSLISARDDSNNGSTYGDSGTASEDSTGALDLVVTVKFSASSTGDKIHVAAAKLVLMEAL